MYGVDLLRYLICQVWAIIQPWQQLGKDLIYTNCEFDMIWWTKIATSWKIRCSTLEKKRNREIHQPSGSSSSLTFELALLLHCQSWTFGTKKHVGLWIPLIYIDIPYSNETWLAGNSFISFRDFSRSNLQMFGGFPSEPCLISHRRIPANPASKPAPCPQIVPERTVHTDVGSRHPPWEEPSNLGRLL